jgi:hypothetical protein
MKKLLFILVIIFSYGKSNAQLMQSNSMGASQKAVTYEKLQPIDKAQSSSDSLIKGPALKIDPGILQTALFNKVILDNISNSEKRLEILKQKQPNQRSSLDKKTIDDLGKEIKTLKTELKTALEKSEKSNSEKFELYDRIYNSLVEKYKSYISSLDEELEKYKQEIDKNNIQLGGNKDEIPVPENVATKGAATKPPRYNISQQTLIIQQKLQNVIEQREVVNTLFLEFKNAQNFIKNHLASKSYLDMSSDEKDKSRASLYISLSQSDVKLNDEYNKLVTNKKAFATDYDAYVVIINKFIDDLNKAAIEQNENGSAENISALAGINKVFGDQGALIPNISVIGSKKFKSDLNSSFYGEVKLFVGGIDDNKKNTGVSNLFIPEASTYGFMTNFTLGFIPSNQNARKNKETNNYEQKLAVNLGVYYLGKKIQPDTVTSFNTNIFHVKIGLQYILIPHVLSAYINSNYMLAVTNISEFEKYYKEIRKVKSFTSFGIESYLELNKKSDFHLLINLGFVNINDDVKSWLNTSDAVIPNVKLSIVKTFDW